MFCLADSIKMSARDLSSLEGVAKEQAFRPQPMGPYLEGSVREFGKLGLAELARFYVCGLQSRPFAPCFHGSGRSIFSWLFHRIHQDPVGIETLLLTPYPQHPFSDFRYR